MKRKFSVIIPAYNEKEHIGSLISRIRTANLGVDFEIIVADGGSTDGTIEESLAAKVKVLKCPAKGRGYQLNYGARYAVGDVFFFIHADSIPPYNFLHQVTQALEAGYDAGCFRLKFNTSNFFLRVNAWLTRFDIDHFRFGDQGLFVTHELYQKCGGYRNDMLLLEDQEMVKRLRRFGARFTVIPDYMHTSPRKYFENGPIRLQFIFLLVWINYQRGKSQEWLVKFYKRRIKDHKIHEQDTKGLGKASHDLHQKPNSGKGENSAG